MTTRHDLEKKFLPILDVLEISAPKLKYLETSQRAKQVTFPCNRSRRVSDNSEGDHSVTTFM